MDVTVGLDGTLGGFVYSGQPLFSVTMTSVPEPSTWALLATGAGALLFFRRRKIKVPRVNKIAL